MNDGSIANAEVPILLAGTPDYGQAAKHVTSYINPMGKLVTCNLSSANCQGTPYQYTTASISNSWTNSIVTVNMGIYIVDVSHTEAYWDWRFAGYQKEGSVDYSQNCHGYAFGVGDWPADGSPGVSIIMSGGCYVTAGLNDAQIAVLNSGNHTIKVTGGFLLNSGFNRPGILSTSEKYRESAIYKQSHSGGVNVVTPINAHGMGASLTGFYKAGGQ